jgi:hypothetical protein
VNAHGLTGDAAEVIRLSVECSQLLHGMAAALERAEVGDAEEAAAILACYVTLDGSAVERKAR